MKIDKCLIIILITFLIISCINNNTVKSLDISNNKIISNDTKEIEEIINYFISNFNNNNLEEYLNNYSQNYLNIHIWDGITECYDPTISFKILLESESKYKYFNDLYKYLGKIDSVKFQNATFYHAERLLLFDSEIVPIFHKNTVSKVYFIETILISKNHEKIKCNIGIIKNKMSDKWYLDTIQLTDEKLYNEFKKTYDVPCFN